jgi:hypothetical protein
VGSYERARYAEARFELARLLRVRLNDPRAAARELEQLWKNHPTSRLVDDALWEGAKIWHALADSQKACSLLTRLQKDAPTSRYVGCISRLCPQLPPLRDQRPCSAYIEREISARPR